MALGVRRARPPDDRPESGRARHAGGRRPRRRPLETEPGPARQRVLGGLTDLQEIARATGARRLLIAIPSASGDVVRRAVEDATRLGLETRTVPAMSELVSGRLGAAAIREVEVTDLLRRDPVVIDETGLRQLHRRPDGPRHRRRRVDRLGAVAPAVRARSRRGSSCSIAPRGRSTTSNASSRCSGGRDSGTASRGGRLGRELVTRLANVASIEAMRPVLGEDRPVMVLHAAAYKHVPMMEHHPADAVYTNIGGTLAALRASLDGRRRAVRARLDRQGGRARAR